MTPAKSRKSSAKAKKNATTSKDVDAFLARVPPDKRAALDKLRQAIKAAAPDATEVISYGMPIFRHNGMLVSFAASANHCGFYVMSPAVMEAHKDELKGYDTSKGTIRFPADTPLPTALVKKLVKARMRENEGREQRRNK